MKSKLDDESFVKLLQSISLEDLQEHASVNLFGDISFDILILQKENYSDYLLNTDNLTTDEEPEKLVEKVTESLKILDKEALTDLMIAFTPEELLIKHLVEYCDEDARIDILENQSTWDSTIKA